MPRWFRSLARVHSTKQDTIMVSKMTYVLGANLTNSYTSKKQVVLD